MGGVGSEFFPEKSRRRAVPRSSTYDSIRQGAPGIRRLTRTCGGTSRPDRAPAAEPDAGHISLINITTAKHFARNTPLVPRTLQARGDRLLEDPHDATGM